MVVLTDEQALDGTAKAAVELAYVVQQTGTMEAADAQRVMLRYLSSKPTTPLPDWARGQDETDWDANRAASASPRTSR